MVRCLLKSMIRVGMTVGAITSFAGGTTGEVVVLPRQSGDSLRGRALVIAHRGASGERPEHSRHAYWLAMEQGAHYVEPDLRMTSDRVFVALHDPQLNRITDVAERPEFAGRARTDAEGQRVWLALDFTAAELKTLRLRQGYSGRSSEWDEQESIMTFLEIVDLVRSYRAETGRIVGIIPELKERGQTQAFVDLIRIQGLMDRVWGVPLYVQSFSLQDLKEIRAELDLPTAWLVGNWPARETWGEIRQYVDALSPNKRLVLANNAAERIAELHDAGFDIIPWTFADDRYDRARFADAREELLQALKNGADAFFTDFPATGVSVRAVFLSDRE